MRQEDFCVFLCLFVAMTLLGMGGAPADLGVSSDSGW